MKRFLLFLFSGLLWMTQADAQLSSDGRKFTGERAQKRVIHSSSRNAQNPAKCGSDTSYYPSYGATAYNSVTIKSGSSLGQFFGANQNITVSGFRMYAYAVTPNPARAVYIRLRCNLYKAGADSLPTGLPLASDTIVVDTVMGSSIPLARIERDAVFQKPVTLNYGYIIAVECDSSNVSAAIVTNSWSAGNGKKKNIGCGSVSGKWYRCLQLNISGATFDADMQLYPFVQYDFGTDFSIVNDCYTFGDTVKFANAAKNNVSSLPYYNYYVYFNLPQFSHRWYYDNSTGYTYSVDGNYRPLTKKNFNVRLISTIYAYTASQCYDTTDKVVYFKPDRPVLKKPANGCIGDTVTINLGADVGTTVNWYHKLGDPNPFQTGNTYTIQNAQNNDTFFVQAVNVDCKSAFLRIDFTVNAYPNIPTVSNDSICIGAVANLSATSNLGKMEWYSNITGGSFIYLGNTLQTGKLTKDSAFYVQANNNGCISKGGRVKVQAFVNNSFAPDKPQVISDTFMCLHPTSTLKIVATQGGTDTLRWFDVPSGGKPVFRGDTFSFTPAFRGVETYYVETWNGLCGSGRSAVNIEVSDYSQIYGLRGDTICGGEDAIPFLAVPWGTVNWYDSKSNNTPVFVGKSPVFSGLISNTTYYLETEENGCKSGIIDSVLILVYSPPTPTSIVADPVCAKGIGNMKVNISSGKVNWYYNAADVNPFYIGAQVSTGLLLGSVTYYFETENNGCKSPKSPVTVIMKPRPTAGFTWVLQWQFKLVCTPITVSDLSISWDWGDGNKTNGAPYIHQYVAKGNYTVRMIATKNSNGCKDTADIPVIIDHTGIRNISNTEVSISPNPVHHGEWITIDGLPHGTNRLQIFGLNGNLVEDRNLTESGFLIPPFWSDGIYFIRIQNGDVVLNSKLVLAAE
ncbi:MAG: T9SS type A sorting domain-containing protein [Bacteroidetes bacterium]|nr:T9SS type A sorting domain-containing protein [Bacteroidota bacterium]